MPGKRKSILAEASMRRAGTGAEVASEGEREHQKREIYASNYPRASMQSKCRDRVEGGQRVHLTRDRAFFMDSLEQLLPVNLTHQTWSQQ